MRKFGHVRVLLLFIKKKNSNDILFINKKKRTFFFKTNISKLETSKRYFLKTNLLLTWVFGSACVHLD
jgi:hypothetical protein